MVFLLISCIVFILVAYWIPKKLSQFEQYTVILFSILLGLLTDVLLDIKYHLYGYISPGVQYAGFLPILILFPVSGVVFINFFPFKKSFLLLHLLHFKYLKNLKK